MNLAIFGGSFDPPHNAHIQIIDLVLQQFKLDRLIVLVAHQNPFKTHYRIESTKRLAFMQELLRHYNNVECSDYEIKQAKSLPSIQSIRHFKNLYQAQKIYFIIGEDNLFTLPQWYQFDELKNEAEFIVIQRDSNPKNNPIAFANHHGITIHYIHFDYDISSSKIITNLQEYLAEIPNVIQQEVLLSLHLNMSKGS